MTMGERIKQLRKEKGLTQEELGKYIGVKKAAIMKYEKGNVKNMKRSSIEILSKLFNVTPSYLMCLDENENNIKIQDVIKPQKVPVLGKISAGLPLYADEQLDGYMMAPETIIKEGIEYFYLRVQGDSMNTKFNDGDLVLVQKQDTLENGEIGAIRVNGFDATVKRFKTQGDLIILEPMSTNPIHTVQIYNPKDVDIKIIGKVIWYMGKI